MIPLKYILSYVALLERQMQYWYWNSEQTKYVRFLSHTHGTEQFETFPQTNRWFWVEWIIWLMYYLRSRMPCNIVEMLWDQPAVIFLRFSLSNKCGRQLRFSMSSSCDESFASFSMLERCCCPFFYWCQRTLSKKVSSTWFHQTVELSNYYLARRMTVASRLVSAFSATLSNYLNVSCIYNREAYRRDVWFKIFYFTQYFLRVTRTLEWERYFNCHLCHLLKLFFDCINHALFDDGSDGRSRALSFTTSPTNTWTVLTKRVQQMKL